jgi:lipopolysaccharide transport system ATP-binding protein
VSALLDLGAGFHPDLTGRENTVLSGILGGLTRREVLERFDSIVAFAEVQAFIDHPVRTYSTGMQMRLAFATAVHTDPDILLIDEALSVGDIAFQRKCLERIAAFRARGCSIIFVSHEASVIQELCDEALWISEGHIVVHGAAGDVVRQYTDFMNSDDAVRLGARAATPEERARVTQTSIKTDTGLNVALDEGRFGSLELEISRVAVLDAAGAPISELRSGQPVQVSIEYRAPQRLVAPLFRVRILRADGLVCYDVNTEISPMSLEAVEGEGGVTLCLDRLDLSAGRYVIDVGCYAPEWTYAYDYHHSVCTLIVRGEGGAAAVLSSPHRWTVGNVNPASVVPHVRPPHIRRA